MFSGYRPLKCTDVEKILKKLGFKEVKKTGGSHRKFKKHHCGVLFKTTLACHKGEVQAKNIRSMISQMGVSKSVFYSAIK
ncbi:MAG: hypothetical protein A6F71_03075 [Cycloclasticus sp. symbiont of Poecilosclerida sp. M]|nr:MAG: hypothetical protein A6F71_03075 [Cycloclasticus sp. symbiont of Poecilosclerida sp. M]